MESFFLAVRVPETSQESEEEICKRFLTLSARVMRWNKSIWILDMGFCFSYWKIRADILSRSSSSSLSVYDHLLSIWKKALQEMMQSLCLENFSELSLQAVLAYHPWNSVLLLEHMRSRSLFGFFDATQSLAKAQIKETSWDVWRESLLVLADHYEGVDSKIKVQKFRRSIDRWMDSMSNLCIKKPSDLIGTDLSAIKRRYGFYVAQAWEWSYESLYSGGLFATFAQDARLQAFPWTSFKAQTEIRIQRNLDFSPQDWVCCEIYLQEDFDRILSHPQWNEEARISELEWTIRYADVDDLRMTIRFRHPYNPYLYRGHHRAALAQAYYAYISHRREDQEDFVFSSNIMLSWQIVVKKVFYLSSQIHSLFESSLDPKDKELLELENQLQIPLEQYWLFPDWFAEDSFKDSSFEADAESLSCLDWKKNEYLSTAMCRPMYLLDASDAYGSLSRNFQDFESMYLQEELMQKWWLNTSSFNEETLYSLAYFYRALDSKSSHFWVEGDNLTHTLKIRGVYG